MADSERTSGEGVFSTAEVVTRPDMAPLVSKQGALEASRHPRLPFYEPAGGSQLAAPAIESIRVIGGATDTGPGSAPLPATKTSCKAASCPPSPCATGTLGCPFVQARYYTRTDLRLVDLLVLHTMEAPEKPNTAMAVAKWFATEMKDASGVARPASAHYCIDASQMVQCVRDLDVAYGAPGANHNGIQLEHAGYASQSDALWHDAYSQSMLALSAKLAACLVELFDIPVKFVDAEDLIENERGITTHREVTRACQLAKQRGLTASPFFKAKNSHTDPGIGFPMIEYLAAIRCAQQET